MSKISLVSRRKDKYFDSPTAASQRAQQRLAEQTAPQPEQPASKQPLPPPHDLAIKIEEGSPTVELNVPSQPGLNVETLAKEYLQGKDKAKILTVIEKEKIGETWGLKLQFLPEQPSKLLSAKQLAQMFSVSPHTIYHLLKQGVIKGYKIGRHWRFNWSEVLESLGKQQGES